MTHRSKTIAKRTLSRTIVQAVVLLASLTGPVAAESYQSIRARMPVLFDPATGYRIDRQRAPVPDDIPPPALPVDAEETAKLLGEGAIALDVFGARASRYDELDGTWMVSEPRMSLPGATWLPETGRGTLDAVMQRYLAENLERITNGDKRQTIVVFCVSDCWMSWNAAQRIATMGYENVRWFRHGTDDWLASGRSLAPVDPLPVDVD